MFVNRSAGTMIDCSIFNNRLAGITCTSKSKPVFRNCQIYNGRDVGVLLLDRSEAYFKNCQIYSNKLAGIEIKNGANPTVTNSVIRDGETGGIYFNTKGNGFFRLVLYLTHARMHHLVVPSAAIVVVYVKYLPII